MRAGRPGPELTLRPHLLGRLFEVTLVDELPESAESGRPSPAPGPVGDVTAACCIGITDVTGSGDCAAARQAGYPGQVRLSHQGDMATPSRHHIWQEDPSMNLTLTRLLGVTAAVTMGAAALLGPGAGTAGAASRAHCDRAEQDMWSSGGPSRNLTGHHCSVPNNKRRWYTIEIDTLVQTHYKRDTLDGGVVRTETLHNRTVRCMGYTSSNGRVNWFGCPAA
jgi:hypothetical protein